MSDTAERILDAAAVLFAERGYGGTTTRAVAERAGVNEVTVFRRFKNKAGLLDALFGTMATQPPEIVTPTAPPDGPVDPAGVRATLTELARAEITNAVRHGALAVRIAFDARSIPEVAARFRAGTGANLAAVSGYIADRQAGGDLRGDVAPELLAEAFFALTSSFVLGRQLRGEAVPPEGPELDRLAEQLVELLWGGACADALIDGHSS